MRVTRAPRRFQDLRSPDVHDALEGHALILPFGSMEQHGPHLPVSVDLDLATAFASDLTLRLEGLLGAPLIYGARSLPQSGGGPSFPGTIRVRGTILIEYIGSILEGYIANGARRIIIINGHYENEAFILESLECCRERGQLDACSVLALSWWSLVSDEFIGSLFPRGFPGWHAEHAGVSETSLMMHLHPELVTPVDIEHPTPPRVGIYAHPVEPKRTSTRGVLSRTTGCSAQIGARLFAHVCDELERLARYPNGLDPSEEHPAHGP